MAVDTDERPDEGSAAPQSGGAGPTVAGSVYRPHLDGLRAVAVYLVVLFHARVDHFAGAFVGVDVFFVLSGYLVTELLLRDTEGIGHVRLPRFYARRYRRLLPAAFATLVVTAVAWMAVASPAEVIDSAGGFRASFLYYANWFFLNASNDYFAADVSQSPVLHFWSLAVEEQFYLAWPLLLGGLFWLTRSARNQRAVLRVIVAAGAVASLSWALYLARTDLNRAYYGTDSRAYQLLAGALLALTVAQLRPLTEQQRTRRGLLAGAALAATIVGATTIWTPGVVQRGFFITITTAICIAALETSSASATHRVLGSPAIVYLGRISYATYLWHWPVIIIATKIASPSPRDLALISAGLATSLASLSYRLLEHPIRANERLHHHAKAVIAAGLALSIGGGLLVFEALENDANRVSSTPTPFEPDNTPAPDWRAIRNEAASIPHCDGGPLDECVIVSGTGDGPSIMLMGDSHAGMLIPTFERIAADHNLTLSVAASGGCGWQENVYPPLDKVGAAACRERKPDWYERIVPELDPDVIVLVNFRGGSEDDTKESLETLRRPGRTLVVVEPVPRSARDMLTCLSQQTDADCRFVTTEAPSSVDVSLRALDDANDDVIALNLDPIVCPHLPICDPRVDGIVVRRDNAHLSRAYAASIAKEVETVLVDRGLSLK